MQHQTFATLLNRKMLVPARNSAYIAVDRDFLVALLSPMLSTIFVDESWYLERNPDVVGGIARGDFYSGADHYAKVGYFEHRMPYPIEVDDIWYLENYPDIAAAVQRGIFPTGQDHFYRQGYREGRFPHTNFVLKSRPER